MSNVFDVVARAAVKGATFASFLYTNKEGETSLHRITLGFDLFTLYRKDLDILRPLLVTLRNADTPDALAVAACEKIIASREASLTGFNPDYAHHETYTALDGVKGVKVHRETGELHIAGLSRGKRVLSPGTYKVVKSAPATLARKAIEKTLPSAKYRQFKLSSLTQANMRGECLRLR